MSMSRIYYEGEGERYNVDVRYIFGCSFLPGGNLVLACGNSGLKLLDRNFSLIQSLPMKARNVCVINENVVLVTKGDMKELQYVQVVPVPRPGRIIKMDRKCYGVDCHDDVIYVTCHDFPGNGEIRAIDGRSDDGRVLRRLGFDKGRYMFSQPDYVKVNSAGDKLFVSDSATYIVTCLDPQGQVFFYRISDTNTSSIPKGIFLDGDDCYICLASTNSVCVVSNDHQTLSPFLTEESGIVNPFCLAKRQTDGCLVVGLLGKDNALIAFSREQ